MFTAVHPNPPAMEAENARCMADKAAFPNPDSRTREPHEREKNPGKQPAKVYISCDFAAHSAYEREKVYVASQNVSALAVTEGKTPLVPQKLIPELAATPNPQLDEDLLMKALSFVMMCDEVWFVRCNGKLSQLADKEFGFASYMGIPVRFFDMKMRKVMNHE